MLKVGEIINGKYQVTRVLGEGGMGIVVQAHHEALDMHVAIKFMRSDLVAAGGGAERFLREARALVKLKSQHAVKVHDLGVHRHMPFIVMEHLEGSDLQTILDKQGPIHPADVAKYMRQACEAIAEAHSLGIYHRDLKPANLFLARGASDRLIVKVLDFGIAKMMRPDDKKSLQNSLTGANILMGTLPYMSPEQLKSPKDVDGRADIWSLGVVMYELVTGELPFQGRDLYEVQQAIYHEACLMPEMPSALKSIIGRCLEKSPEDRYQSVVDLAVELRPVMQESLSPFGVPSRDHRVRFKHQKSPLLSAPSPSAAPTAPAPLLAATEGLPAAHDDEAATLRFPNTPRMANVVTKASPGGFSPNEPITLRVQGKVVLDKPTVRMPKAAESKPISPAARPNAPPPPPRPSRPPVAALGVERKNPLNELPQKIVPVRRGVLVVEQPIQFSRRRRNQSRATRLFVGAFMTCMLVFGVALWRDHGAQSAIDTPNDAEVAHN